MKDNLFFSNSCLRSYSMNVINYHNDVSEGDLHTLENKDISNICMFKRKKMKILGKKLIKSMYKSEYGKEVIVLTGDKGRPYLFIEGHKYNTISISHSIPFIVGVLGSGNIGVDIEKIRFHETFQSFFTKEEYNLCMKTEDPSFNCTIVWVLKEAYLKLVGIGFEYGFHGVEIFIRYINKKIDIKIKVNDSRIKVVNQIYFDIYKKQNFILGVVFE